MHGPHLFCTGSVVVTRPWLSLAESIGIAPGRPVAEALTWALATRRLYLEFEKMSMATRVSERTGDLLLPFLAGVSSCFYAAIV